MLTTAYAVLFLLVLFVVVQIALTLFLISTPFQFVVYPLIAVGGEFSVTVNDQDVTSHVIFTLVKNYEFWFLLYFVVNQKLYPGSQAFNFWTWEEDHVNVHNIMVYWESMMVWITVAIVLLVLCLPIDMIFIVITFFAI